MCKECIHSLIFGVKVLDDSINRLTKKEPDWVGLEVNRRELEKYVKVLTGNKCISETLGEVIEVNLKRWRDGVVTKRDSEVLSAITTLHGYLAEYAKSMVADFCQREKLKEVI